MTTRITNSGPGQAPATPACAPDQDADLHTSSLYIVIAAYNEQSTIGATVASLRKHFDHVIVVNDGSNDRTAEYAHHAGATVLSHILNRGQGAALQTGIEYALLRGAGIIVTFDADGQHQCEDIAALIQPVTRGDADVALGSRFLKHSADVPPIRRVLLRAALLFTRITSGLSLTDTHNGLRAFSRDAASLLTLRQDRMAHASEILDRIYTHRLRFVEVPTRILYTDYSRGKGQRTRGALRIVFDYLIDKVLP